MKQRIHKKTYGDGRQTFMPQEQDEGVWRDVRRSAFNNMTDACFYLQKRKDRLAKQTAVKEEFIGYK